MQGKLNNNKLEENMKKIVVLIALVTFAFNGSAFAGALASGSVTTTDGLQIFGGSSAAVAAGTTSVLLGKCSKGVKFGATFTTAGFAVDTKHNSGSMAYGTAHDSTAIYKTELGVDGVLAAPSAASNTSFATWTAM
jgi:hypothetical protein